MLASPVLENGQGGDSEGTLSTGQHRILVVDDNLDSAKSLALMLRMMGNETRTANDGLEALEIAADYEPNLIMLDIGMPRLNGYETARRIRDEKWGRDIVLVALTGWGQEEDRRKSHEAGFDSHIVKPIEPDSLEKLLSSLPTNGPSVQPAKPAVAMSEAMG
jgi:CheY-like chemotaxis protein